MNPAIASMTRFTVAAWISHGVAVSGYDSIFSRQVDDTVMEVFNLALLDDAPAFVMPKTYQGAPVTTYKVVSARPVPLNQWVHLAASFDGSTARLYQDGQEVGSFPYPYALPSTTTPLYLGTNKNPAINEPFDGRIDEVLLYSSALSASAIAALAAGGAPPPR
jgi:Concanavalin A-like lectin/glucanases superfamily